MKLVMAYIILYVGALCGLMGSAPYNECILIIKLKHVEKCNQVHWRPTLKSKSPSKVVLGHAPDILYANSMSFVGCSCNS